VQGDLALLFSEIHFLKIYMSQRKKEYLTRSSEIPAKPDRKNGFSGKNRSSDSSRKNIFYKKTLIVNFVKYLFLKIGKILLVKRYYFFKFHGKSRRGTSPEEMSKRRWAFYAHPAVQDFGSS
jgi:hypothetical protein